MNNDRTFDADVMDLRGQGSIPQRSNRSFNR